MRARHAPTAPPPFPARDEAESGRRGTPRNHVFEGYAGSPASLGPAPAGGRTCHVTASSTASATRLVAALLQAPSPPGGSGSPWRPTYHGPRPRTRRVSGRSSVIWGCPRRPVRKDRFAETPCVARRGPKRWRNRATDAGAVSSFQAPRPGPSRGLPRGRRAVARNHIIGILSRFSDRADARRARGPGLERGSHASESHPCAMSQNHAAVRFPRCR